MDLVGWTASIGGLLLLVSLLASVLRERPMTTFVLYLLAGIAVGPWGLDVLPLDLASGAPWAERLTEIALVISLFIGGLKLRISPRSPHWRLAARLAWPGMLLTVTGLAVLTHWGFDLDWPHALVLGAVLAPTDPVLASLVTVDSARDQDGLRVGLSGEAGFNDGTALPLLLLALLMLGAPEGLTSAKFGHWLLQEAVYSVIGGLILGFLLGGVIGLFGTHLRNATRDCAPTDSLAIALMALTYAAAQATHVSLFLAIFAAGLGLRYAEVRIVDKHPHPHMTPDDDQTHSPVHPPAELLINRNDPESGPAHSPTTSVGMVVSDALSFGDSLERLLAAALVFLLGACVATHFSISGAVLALLLFGLIRPLAVYMATIGSGLSRPRRWLLGWFGIKGIGCINYFSFALQHGLEGPQAHALVDLTVTVVVLSVLLHGISAQPLLAWRQARQQASSNIQTGTSRS